uniref:Uncharacterized protein n=1 Tax=Trichobilharzia regenti TaxID=157069 RepID=A0AA85JBY2_TRIRE|nr:unnamed protein product [Trichobilharzia regenti]
MNLMPVGLMFDVNITGGEEWLNSLNLTNLCRFYDVSLTTRPTKSREFWKTVALRTTERNISSMYIVCRRIRDLLLDNAIDNSIYASKSLNSMSYQLHSDKLWLNDIFKSNNQYKEVERFSNRGRMTFDDTEGCTTINQEEGNKENMTLIAPPLSSYSTPATTSMKPIVNTITIIHSVEE